MKKFLSFALTLTALVATSCQKEDIGRVLTATIEHYEQDNNAKVYVNASNYACWNNGDSVSINGQKVRLAINSDANEATIPIPPGMEDANLLAFYPAREAMNMSATTATVTLPQKQRFLRDGEGNQIVDNPMAAYSPAGGTELKFGNLCALLKITLPAREDGKKVHSITVKGVEGHQLCGEATLKLNEDNQPRLSVLRNGCDSVTLSGIDEELTSAKSYYIVVPAFTSFADITISVVLEKDLTFYMNRKTKDNFDHILERNHIGAFSYNWNHVETFSGYIIRYITSNQSIITPSGMSGFDNSEYGVLCFSQPVTSIANKAFEGCKKLTTIALPECVTSIGDEAFQQCYFLTSITLPAGLTSIGDNVFNGCNLTSITLPERLTSIGDGAFVNCQSLSSITLPAGLTSIGMSAFQNCRNLTSIDLPASLTKIKARTFSDCTALETVNVGRWGDDHSITAGGDKMFDNCSSDLKIYVPTGSADTYKGASYWSTYSNMIFER